MSTDEVIPPTGATSPESGPIMVPWRLSKGNYVAVTWLNWQGRSRETIGYVESVTEDVVVLRPRHRKKAEDRVSVGFSRITGVEVIQESDEGIEARKHAWQIAKRAAGHINSRTKWDRDAFLRDLRKLIDLFPEIQDRDQT